MKITPTIGLRGSIGQMLENFIVFRKAKRLCSEIRREMSFFETKFLKKKTASRSL